MKDGARATPGAFVVALLFLLAFALYGGELRYPLVYDDVYWFGRANLRVLAGIGFGPRFLSKKYAYLLARLSHGDVAYLHLAGIFLHVLVAAALFLFLRRLVAAVLAGSPPEAQRQSGMIAAIAALIFAVHPVQVYTVACPGEQEIMLATLFSILCLAALLEGLRRRGPWWLAASVAAYAAAVLSKPNVVMVPALAVAMTLLIERPSRATVRRLAVPLCGLGAIALGALYMSALNPPAVPATGFPMTRLAFASGAENGISYGQSAITQAGLFFRYGLLVLVPDPAWMAIDLQLPLAKGASGWAAVGVIAFLVWPAAAAALIFRRGSWGLVGFGLLWPWLLFLTEFATVRSLEAFVLYRLYPWIIGPCLVAATGIAVLVRRGTAVVTAALVGGLCLIAHGRIATFASSYQVWDDAVHKNRASETVAVASFRPYLNRGVASLAAGRAAAALQDFRTAARLAPDLPTPHFDVAVAHERLGQYDAALAAMNAGLARAGRVYKTTLARAYADRAAIFLDLRRPQDAIADLDRAARLDPEQAEYRDNAGRLRAAVGGSGAGAMPQSGASQP